jgi:hypothetical protein
VRDAFAVEALIRLEPGGDARAPGGAVTLAICGAFAHPGPCPLAPHRTTAEERGDDVALRVVAACDADRREEVIRLVTGALAAGSVVDPDGVVQRWRLLRSGGACDLTEAERVYADRLLAAD